MIFLKLVLIVTVCYIISKGLVIDYELETKRYKDELNETRSRVKDAYTLMEEEKKVLINTINELRLELNQYKQR